MSIHGGDIYRNHVDIDFSTNMNPFGIPNDVKEAMHEAVELCSQYPDMEAEKLKKALSTMLAVPEEYLLFGNGASELFMAIVHGIKPKKTIIPIPSFYGYEYVAKAAESEIIYYEMKKGNQFRITEDFREVLTEDAELIFLANPNNPTGNLIGKEDLKALLRYCKEKEIYVVLDECFIAFSGSRFSMVSEIEEFDNVIIVGAFTKLFSIPGVRLGYLVCKNYSLLIKTAGQLPEWNLSCFAQAAGHICAMQKEYIQQTEQYVKKERQFLTDGLQQCGFLVFPSAANFLLVYGEADLYGKLLEKGILIRDCENFKGLRRGFYRIAVKTRKENEILLETMRNIKNSPIECLLPEEIEKRSFAIIGEELARRKITLAPEEELIVKRVIHTSADFDYVRTLCFSKKAAVVLKKLIQNGADIVTDTNMALAGINKSVLAKFGGSVHCFMADEEIARLAKEKQTTRAAVSMEQAAKMKKPVIFAIGNAPTALIKLYEMIQESDWRPAFIIGVPVGFVNVEAAKELILQTDVPYIVNIGRKGGSTVAAAICNAVLYQIRDAEK